MRAKGDGSSRGRRDEGVGRDAGGGRREGRAYKLLHRIVVSLRPVTTRPRHRRNGVRARVVLLSFAPHRASSLPHLPCAAARARPFARG